MTHHHQQREKILQSCYHKFYLPTAFHSAFQLLAQTPHVRFHGQKWVHARLCSKDRTQAFTRRNRGHFGWGAIITLDTYCTFTNIPGPGIRTANFAVLGSWPGGAPKERREPSEQRCAHAHRCSEGVAAPLGCVILFLLSELWLVCPVLRAFPRVRDEGGITTLGVLCVLPKRRTSACQSGSFAAF